MTFDEYLSEYKSKGGTQKGLGIDIGISEAAMSRLVHKKQRVGLRMLNRIVGASKSKIRMQEAMKEFRPDLYKMFKGEV